jgi:hypothetical protein
VPRVFTRLRASARGQFGYGFGFERVKRERCCGAKIAGAARRSTPRGHKHSGPANVRPQQARADRWPIATPRRRFEFARGGIETATRHPQRRLDDAAASAGPRSLRASGGVLAELGGGVLEKLLQLARTYGRAVPGGVRIDFPLTDQLLADMGGLGSRERQSRAFRPCARRFPPSSALPVCPQIGPQELFSTSGDGTARAIGTRTALDPVPSAAARGPYNRRAPALTSGRGRP